MYLVNNPIVVSYNPLYPFLVEFLLFVRIELMYREFRYISHTTQYIETLLTKNKIMKTHIEFKADNT
jgi:hypothetical protein